MRRVTSESLEKVHTPIFLSNGNVQYRQKNYFGKNEERGITLVALVVTIVVLLILAGITIATLFGDNGIIKKAQKAKEETETSSNSELDGLDEIEETMKNAINGIDKGDTEGGENGGEDLPNEPEEEYNKATVNEKVDSPSTMDGNKPNENNPYIPKGFKPINTDTSRWDAEEGPQVNKGLVISDGNSEFVFIPVANINDMIMCQTHGASQSVDKKTLQCSICKTNTKLAGKLYTFSETTSTVNPTTYTKGSGNREPDNIPNDNNTRLKNETWTEDLYQECFDKMAKSVAKNKGFYVGRYETSLNGNTVQSKVGQTPMNNIDWWKMYENSKTYSKSNTSLGVTSEMIWGCQWDAMMRFLLTTSDAENVTSMTNVGHNPSQFKSGPYKTGGTNYSDVYTGTVAYNDISANIYDLSGNCYEWSQEASKYTDNFRGIRGGVYNYYSCAEGNSSGYGPTATADNHTSRLVIY